MKEAVRCVHFLKDWRLFFGISWFYHSMINEENDLLPPIIWAMFMIRRRIFEPLTHIISHNLKRINEFSIFTKGCITKPKGNRNPTLFIRFNHSLPYIPIFYDYKVLSAYPWYITIHTLYIRSTVKVHSYE